jgi:putative hydrolase of the HAD superfamily
LLKRAVLLDLDDTLLDERPGRLAAREGLLAALGAALPELPAAALAAALDRETRWFWADAGRHASGRLDLLAARRVIVSRTLETIGAPDEALAAAAARRYTELRDEHLAWMPGAPEALAALRASVPRLALLTNGAAEAQRAKLVRFDLERFFDHVQIEGAFGEGKPSAGAFRHALAALGAEPEQAVMVGNDFEFDVLGALGAGLDAVWIDVEGEGAPAPAPRAFAAVRSIGEVPPLLGAAGEGRKRARFP